MIAVLVLVLRVGFPVLPKRKDVVLVLPANAGQWLARVGQGRQLSHQWRKR